MITVIIKQMNSQIESYQELMRLHLDILTIKLISLVINNELNKLRNKNRQVLSFDIFDVI